MGDFSQGHQIEEGIMLKSKVTERVTATAHVGCPPMQFEAINWKCVADKLDQQHRDYLQQVAEAKDERAMVAGMTIAAVLGSLADAIREGLE